MILPDTPLVELSDVEGVIITEAWCAGDRDTEKL